MAAGGNLIIFIGSGKVFLADSGRVLPFDFPANSVKDWDVVNRQALEDSLNTFVAANKIEAGTITFVLSENACFSKDIVVKDPSKLDAEVEEFLAAVPFNYVISKTYKIGNGVRIIASNKDLIDSIYEVFETRGFSLSAVVPAAIFPQEGAKKELDMRFVKVIEDSNEIIQGGNMIAPKPAVPESPTAPAPAAITTNKASSGYLPYLIGVGALAIIVLVVLVILRR